MTINNFIDAQGVYLIVGVQEGAINRYGMCKRENNLYNRIEFTSS